MPHVRGGKAAGDAGPAQPGQGLASNSPNQQKKNGSATVTAPSSNMTSLKDLRAQPKSKLLMHEVRLQERQLEDPAVPSLSVTLECFKILDEVIPQAGALSRILSLVTDKLREAVFSDALTANEETGEVSPVPFFIHTDRIVTDKQSEIERTTSMLTEAESTIKSMNRDGLMVNKRNMVLKQQLAAKEKAIDDAKARALLLEQSLQQANATQTTLMQDCDLRVEKMKQEVQSMHAKIEHTNKIIEQLQQFKKAYTDLENNAAATDHAVSHRTLHHLDHRSLVQAGAAEDVHLLKQLDNIMNLQLDDYETSLSAIYKKKRLLSEMATAPDKRLLVEQDYLRDVGDLENNYRKKVKEIHEERHQLTQHMDVLQATLQRIEKDATFPSVKRADDHILRRHAVIMLTSHDHGKTFWETREAVHCPKCSERTVLCPHKSATSSILPLPPNTSHLKFDYIRFSNTKEGAGELPPSPLPPLGSGAQNETLDRPDLNVNMPRRYRILYRTYFRHWQGTKPREQRNVPTERMHEWIEEMYESRWQFEEAHEANGRVNTLIELPFLDYFYHLMTKRYFQADVANHVAYDLISTMLKQDLDSNQVHIFAKTLVGDDDCTWKYVYLVKKLLAHQKVADIVGYRKFLRILYPFRSQEVLDAVELEFIAWSKNRVSKELVEEHVRYMLVRKQELNHKAYAFNLRKYDYQDTGTLSPAQFEEAMLAIFPPGNVALRQTRYGVSQNYFEAEQVPIDRLATIACYVVLFATMENGWVPKQIVKGLAGMVIEEDGWIKTRPDRRFNDLTEMGETALNDHVGDATIEVHPDHEDEQDRYGSFTAGTSRATQHATSSAAALNAHGSHLDTNVMEEIMEELPSVTIVPMLR